MLLRLVGFCQARRKQKVARFGLLRTVLFRYLLHYNLVPVLTKKGGSVTWLGLTMRMQDDKYTKIANECEEEKREKRHFNDKVQGKMYKF